MTDPFEITRRIERARYRMLQGSFKPTKLTLGRVEARAMVDYLDEVFGAATTEEQRTQTVEERLAGAKYMAMTIECDDRQNFLRIEGIWFDPLLDRDDFPN